MIQTSPAFDFKGFPIDLNAITFDLAESNLREIKELFFIEGLYSPIINWCALSQNDWPEEHKTIYEFWIKNYRVADISKEIILSDPLIMPLKDSVILTRSYKPNNDFIVEFAGEKTNIATAVPPQTKTSHLDILHTEQTAATLFDYVCYGAVAVRGQPLLNLYQNHKGHHHEMWSCLIVPIHNLRGEVCYFITSTICSKHDDF